MTAIQPKTYEIGQFVGYVPVEEPIDLTPNPDEPHYWLQTEGGREMTAQANLLIQKIPFYLPTMLRAARLPNGRHLAGEEHPDVMAPLFPRTIFISEKVLAAKENRIRSTPGMASNPFVKFGERYAVLKPLAMQAIQYIEAAEKELYYRARNRKNAPVYMPNVGETVVFMVEEVLGGQRGKVDQVDDDGRITILMEIMKRTVRVRTTADRIEPV